jgi:hypothetical protein
MRTAKRLHARTTAPTSRRSIASVLQRGPIDRGDVPLVSPPLTDLRHGECIILSRDRLRFLLDRSGTPVPQRLLAFAFAVAIERTRGTGARARSSVTGVYCCITSRESRARNTRLVTAKPGCRTQYENHDATATAAGFGRRSEARRTAALRCNYLLSGRTTRLPARKSFKIESLMSRTQQP